jgi:hypothetical protein
MQYKSEVIKEVRPDNTVIVRKRTKIQAMALKTPKEN